MNDGRAGNITISAFMIVVGLVLPFCTGQIPQIGSMLLPMHIPVFLCGLICGKKYGLMTGMVLPLLRSVVFGRPVMYPNALAMAFELGTYGAVIGWAYNRNGCRYMKNLLRAMVLSMVSGRIVWAATMALLLMADNGVFTMQMFISGALVNSVPGIIVQFIMIPAIMSFLNKNRVIPFAKRVSFYDKG